MRDTIVIIPARGGSKRLPGKNTMEIHGKPLIAHSIAYAKANSAIVKEVYVSTDDAQIAQVAKAHGAKVLMRPKEFATDHSPTVAALKDALLQLGSPLVDVVLLQPTNPLRPELLLKQAYQTYITQKVDSLMCVSPSEHKLGKIKDHTFLPYNYTVGQRSQDLEPLYYENGLLYIIAAELIMQDTIVSEKVYPYVIDHIFATVDIDTQQDFKIASLFFNLQ